jgi:hypothetical protein
MDPTAISEQIDRILRSRGFASKSQLRKLLQVLHQNMLQENLLRENVPHENKDSPAGLTSDQVIRELWPTEIRTKRAADVATEMNRLRHALKSYYAEEGASDPITISLPKRASGAVEGSRGQPWMVAVPCPGTEDEAGKRPRRAPANTRRSLKIVGVIAAVCAALAVVAYVSIRMLAVHDEPKFGRLDGSTLRIMDGEGKELWSKTFPEGFGPDWYWAQGLGNHIWIGDLEGKGHTSVLFVYSAAGPLSHSSTLICYSDRGKEKWRWTPGRELPELVGSPATFLTVALGVLKAKEKRPPRIVASSQYHPWWPSQIAILDSDGKTISEYWHSGVLSSMVMADLDGDGREEIVAVGVANGYDHQATLVVLDPDQVFGASSEVRPEFQIHGMGAAQERVRLLFPRSDLNKAVSQFNMAMDPTVEHGILRLTVAECIIPLGCQIWYEFDKNFRLIAAYAGGDEFRGAHARFYQNGKDAHELSAEEQAAFQKVRCLVGCKSEFVAVGKLVP